MRYWKQSNYTFSVGMCRIFMTDDGGAYIEAQEGAKIRGAVEITQAEFEEVAKSRETAPETQPAPQEAPAIPADQAELVRLFAEFLAQRDSGN